MKFIEALTLTAILLATSACSSGGSIQDAYMATAPDGLRTITYGQTDTFYAIVLLAEALASTEVTARWFAVEVGGVEGERQLEETTSTSADAELTFHLSNNMHWPLGLYRVDILLNGELDRSLEFEVQ